MNSNKLSKIRFFAFLTATLLIAAFVFMPIFSIPTYTDEVLYEEFEPVLIAAYEKECKDSSNEETAINAKYAELKEILMGVNANGEPINAKFTSSGIDVILSIAGTVEVIEKYNLVQDIEDKLEEINALSLDQSYLTSGKYKEDIEILTDLRIELAEIDYEAVNEKSIKNFTLLLSAVSGYKDALLSVEDQIEDFRVEAILIYFIAIFLKFIFLIMALIVLPLTATSAAIKVIIRALKKRNAPDELFAVPNKVFLGAFSSIAVVLTAAAIWGASLTVWGWVIIGVSSAAYIIAAVQSRTLEYTATEKKVLNYTQICTAVTLIGMIIFTVFITCTDLIGFYTDEGMLAVASKGEGVEAYHSAMSLFGLFSMLVMLSYVVIFSLLISHFNHLSNGKIRFSTIVDYASITAPALATVFLVINIIFMLANGVAPIGAEKTAFILATVGVCISLAGVLMYLVFRHCNLIPIIKCNQDTEELAEENKTDAE